MKKRISLLDCTLRDGSYINGSMFGANAIKGLIKSLQAAGTEIIECGWLKDTPHQEGSAYYHVPSDLESYIEERREDIIYVAMIDWDRYDVSRLTECDHRTLDAIRVVFPRGKVHDGLKVAEAIRSKGYGVFVQVANTLGYTDEDLAELVAAVNNFKPVGMSVVDTFGAMYPDDIVRIVDFIDRRLDKDIALGFHSHNNQQLSFALTMRFIERLQDSDREIIIDASLSGMGRGAGNTTTELVVNYLNSRQGGEYDIDAILGAIDLYINPMKEMYAWGYSTPYLVAGAYQCHVNNIAYLQERHQISSRDMRKVIASLEPEERRHYDYDLLEQRYQEKIGR